MKSINGYIAHDGLAGEMFRLAVEACPNGMVMIDAAGKMVMVNSEVEHQFGYTRDELIGMPVEMLLPARLRGQPVRYRSDDARGGRDLPAASRMLTGRDLFGLRKDGSEFPVEVGLNPINAGEHMLVLSVIVDISQRKQIERLKEEFVSTVSHELRTPLTSIAGSLGLLAGHWSGKLPEPAARLLAIAHNNSQRLVRLINDILDIEKLDSGRVAFNFERISARVIVEQAIEENSGFAEQYGVVIRLDADAAETEVNIDPDRMSQVVTNLLSNAVKFSPAGGHVDVGLVQEDAVVRISVRDHGPGIPEAFRPHIFKKFSQADGTLSKAKGGTGLGLSIVKQIMERLGGEVSFADADGGGTVFHLQLPKWDGVQPGDIDDAAAAGAIRILLCDDDRESAENYRAGFREAGLLVDFAATAAAAAARMDAHRYAALVIALPFHDSDGMDLLQRIRSIEHYGETPIVVVASNSLRRRRDPMMRNFNVLEWVSKPVDFQILSPILLRAVQPGHPARNRILHVDDDRDVLALVANELGPIADMVSVDSLESARRSLASEHFDLAVLDIEIGSQSGLDLLPDLLDRNGNLIPVVIFSAHSDCSPFVDQVHFALSKAGGSIESLGAVVQDRLAILPRRAFQEIL